MSGRETSTVKRKRSESPTDSNRSDRKPQSLNGVPDNTVIPLAKQLIPKKLEDFVGQQHIVGPETMLHAMLKRGDVPNMIIWGPPGNGKTSLTSIVKEICKSNPDKYVYHTLNAAHAGVKDISTITTQASNDSKRGKKTIIILEEIHKFNKKQQDVFLGPIEQGHIILIGTTTENPSMELTKALLSRCRLLVFETLTTECITEILIRATTYLGMEVFNQGEQHDFDQDTTYIERTGLEWMAHTACGDARIALNNLEIISKCYGSPGKVITHNDIKEGVKKSLLNYDKKGEEHYNLISALHKSIRGSDPDAALYWVTRMIVGGESPVYIARRMIRAASEDIGEADPQALALAVATFQGCQLLGMPEADILLAQCAVYLARAEKSRSIDTALAMAKKCIIEQGKQPQVPMHLRNAPNQLMRDLGYGKTEDYEGFMPEELKDVKFL